MDPVVQFATVPVYADDDAEVDDYYAGSWRTFRDGIEVLPASLTFRLADGSRPRVKVPADAVTFVPSGRTVAPSEVAVAEPTATPVPEATPTPEPSEVAVAEPTPTPTPTPAPTATPTPAPSEVAVAEPTPTPSPTPTTSPTPEPSEEPVVESTATPTAAPSEEAAVEPTPTPGFVIDLSGVATPTPAPSEEPVVEPTPTPELSEEPVVESTPASDPVADASTPTPEPTVARATPTSEPEASVEPTPPAPTPTAEDGPADDPPDAVDPVEPDLDGVDLDEQGVMAVPNRTIILSPGVDWTASDPALAGRLELRLTEPELVASDVGFAISVENVSTTALAEPVVVEVAVPRTAGLQLDGDVDDWSCAPLGDALLECAHPGGLPAASTTVLAFSSEPTAIGVLRHEPGSHLRDVLLAVGGLLIVGFVIVGARRVPALVTRRR